MASEPPVGRVPILWVLDAVGWSLARRDRERSLESGVLLPAVRPEADFRMTDNSNSDGSDREQQGIEGNVALETWSQRVTTQIYGDGELKIHGPYYQHSKDDDPYIRLTLTADDCDHDDSGGTFSFSVGLASAGVLATVIHDACEREPEVLLGELSETDEDADDGGDSA